MKHIINDFTTLGGKHCVTNALKQILNYYGYPVSEEFILGVASGISFTYLSLSKTPMALGRAKPFIF